MGGLTDVLRAITDEPGSLLLFILVFVTVFVTIAAIGFHLLRPIRTIGPSSDPVHSGRNPIRPESDLTDTPSVDGLLAGSQPIPNTKPDRGKPHSSLAGILGTIHSGLSILILGSLLTLTIAAYLAASPDDLLVPVVLLVITALAAMHLRRGADRFRENEGSSASFGQALQDDLAAKIGAALLEQGKVQWEITSPSVHRIDAETLAQARSMAADGVAMDAICRSIEPEYAQWSEPHRQSYQAMIRAALSTGA